MVLSPLRRVRAWVVRAEPVPATPQGATHAELPWGAPEGDELWMARYVPHNGDLVEPSFRPDYHHEQHSRLPPLVVSNGLLKRHGALPAVPRHARRLRSSTRSSRASTRCSSELF